MDGEAKSVSSFSSKSIHLASILRREGKVDTGACMMNMRFRYDESNFHLLVRSRHSFVLLASKAPFSLMG